MLPYNVQYPQISNRWHSYTVVGLSFQSGLPPGDESPALPREALVRSTRTCIIQTSKPTPASKRVLTCLLNIDVIWYNLSLNSCKRECWGIISIMVVMLLFHLNDCYFCISSDKLNCIVWSVHSPGRSSGQNLPIISQSSEPPAVAIQTALFQN